jgi:SAM-dependent methyltransferase
MGMTSADTGNAEEIAYWNGPGGQHWTERQAAQDTVFRPISEVALARAAAKPGERVIDFGCGTGETTLDLAEQVGASGHVLGIDVSEMMLARAAERTPPGTPVDWLLADATTYDFAPDTYDLLFSRFGVMFFRDPARAFTNMRRALRPGGRLAFCCWRHPRENPWLMAPFTAALKHVPPLPKLGPEDPGPFSFASEDRVRRILGAAGFATVALEPIDLMLDIGAGRGLEEALSAALEVGPTSRALDGQPPEAHAKVRESIREVLTQHLHGSQVLLGAAIWIVTAESP